MSIPIAVAFLLFAAGMQQAPADALHLAGEGSESANRFRVPTRPAAVSVWAKASKSRYLTVAAAVRWLVCEVPISWWRRRRPERMRGGGGDVAACVTRV